MESNRLSRRDFVATGAMGAATLFLGRHVPLSVSPMLERPLGRTGHKVRLFSLGGQATLEKPGRHEVSVAIINRAIDLGVNYIDTAPFYGRGVSHVHIGAVMATRRKEVFLASKTHDFSRDGSLRLLEASLRLLKTHQLDLWQLHSIETEEHLERIFAKDGALQALRAARDQKMVRFLGITGHYDPAILVKAINRFDFDAVLMPLNAADPHHRSFQRELLPLANAKGMGVIAMKVPARGRLFRPGGVTSMRDAMRYTLSLPVSTVIVGCDSVAQLEENVAIAAGFQPLSPAQMANLEGLTAGYQHEAAYFKRGNAGLGSD